MGPDARVGDLLLSARRRSAVRRRRDVVGPRSRRPARRFAQPALPGIAEVTAEARGYGFHATLKPPMRLAPGCTWYGLLTAAQNGRGTDRAVRFAAAGGDRFARVSGVARNRRHARRCRRWPMPAWNGWMVTARAPSEAELARRRRAGLTEAQDAMLVRFGYPYVLETWFFHMTLTRRLSAEEHRVLAAGSGTIFRGRGGGEAAGHRYLPVHAIRARRPVRDRARGFR